MNKEFIEIAKKLSETLGEPSSGWGNMAPDDLIELKFKIPVELLRGFQLGVHNLAASTPNDLSEAEAVKVMAFGIRDHLREEIDPELYGDGDFSKAEYWVMIDTVVLEANKIASAAYRALKAAEREGE